MTGLHIWKDKTVNLVYSMGGERWSWRAGVPEEFSANPNQTQLNQKIKVFRMQLAIFFQGFSGLELN